MVSSGIVTSVYFRCTCNFRYGTASCKLLKLFKSRLGSLIQSNKSAKSFFNRVSTILKNAGNFLNLEKTPRAGESVKISRIS